ncbi:MAG: hypothetical protein ACEY3B_03275 [Wolbachia sp.]
MPTKTFVTELVNAFNLNNYFSDNIYTNFTVQGGTKGKNDKIISSFDHDGDVRKYLKEVREEIISRHYGTEEVTSKYYNLNYFPFVSDVSSGKKKKSIDKNVKVVELAALMNDEVIRNLKIHFAREFQQSAGAEVVKSLKGMLGMTKEEALKLVRGSVQLEKTDRHSPYLYCISFGDRYFKEIGHPNPSGFLGLFRNMYVAEFNLRLERCGFNDSLVFYEYKGNKLYIKDITDINVVRNIAKYVKGEIALDFKTPDKEDSKVENFKNILSELIFEVTGDSVDGYEYDVFTDEEKINDGHSFALIPLVRRIDDQLSTLSREEANKIVEKFYSVLSDIVLSDITGKTESTQFTNCKEPVYAFSNKQIALLLPIIMQSPIAYNKENKRFEFAVDLERHSLITEPDGSRTPPNHGDRDSGYDSNSPPKPKDSVAHSPSGVPRSLFEQPQTQKFSTPSHDGALKESPRQGSEKPLLHDPVNLAGPSKRFSPSPRLGSIAVSDGVSGPSSSSQSVGAAQNVPAGFNLRPQSRPLSRKGVNESGSAWTSQPIGYWSSQSTSSGFSDSLWTQSEPSSWKGADESMRTGKSTWYVSSSGVEDVNNVEHEKQQVSGECSEAKPQESESPKKRRGGFIRGLLSSSLKCSTNLKRNDVGRGTTQSLPPDFSIKKPPLSKQLSSLPSEGEKNVKLLKVTPLNDSISRPLLQGATVVESSSGLSLQESLTNSERKELRLFLSPELRKKLDSNSLSPEDERLKYLLYTSGGKREIKKFFESQGENLRRSVNAQLLSSDNLSSKKVNRDSGFCSIGSASPAVLHKGSVSSELKHPQQVKHMSEALGK